MSIRAGWLALVVVGLMPVASAEEVDRKALNVLFVGNSYTARHNLAELVERFAEELQLGIDFRSTQVIYGGRRLVDHWRLGTTNYLKLNTLTLAEEQATIASLQRQVAADPDDKYAKAALAKHQSLVNVLDENRMVWDVVVLQSYRDDLAGDDSLFVKYAPKFAKLAQAQGARVVLYETTPTTQNAKPLKEAPDPKPVLEKARVIAKLANELDASAAPMSLVALNCQSERPDLTLRYVNDAHLNKAMAYLTACTLYAAIFDASPEGASVNTVADIRYWRRSDGSYDKTRDRDNEPIVQTLSAEEMADLQRIAWEGYQQFQELRAQLHESAVHESAPRDLTPRDLE